MSEKDDKVLFIYDGDISGTDYKEMFKYDTKFYRDRFIVKTLIGLFILGIASLIVKKPTVGLAYFFVIAFIIYEIFNATIGKNRYANITEKNVEKRINNGEWDREFKIDFYEDYFIRDGVKTLFKLYYSDIDSAIETNDCFYLRATKQNRFGLIKKEKCSNELIEFIRSKFPNLVKKETKS